MTSSSFPPARPLQFHAVQPKPKPQNFILILVEIPNFPKIQDLPSIKVKNYTLDLEYFQ